MRLAYPITGVLVTMFGLALGATGCGDALSSIFGGGDDNKNNDNSSSTPPFGGGTGGEGGAASKPCDGSGLCTQQKQCAGGGTTSISGVVYDPAGNYFSDPVHHYGPGSCGSAVLYPRSWLLAYATGAWYLELGPRQT